MSMVLVSLTLFIEPLASFVTSFAMPPLGSSNGRMRTFKLCTAALAASIAGNLVYALSSAKSIWCVFVGRLLCGAALSISAASLTSSRRAIGYTHGVAALCIPCGAFAGSCAVLLLPSIPQKRKLHQHTTPFNDQTGGSFILAFAGIIVILPLVVFAISITLKGIFFERNNSAAPPAASRKQNVPSKAAPYQLYPAGIYIALIESTKYATLAASPLFFGFTRGWSERACIFYFVLCSLFDILARVAVAFSATFARKRGVLSLAIRFTTTCLAAVLRWGIYSNLK